jgi:uncharacterized membrane protein
VQFSRERALVLTAATAAFGLSALLRKVAVDRLHPLYFQVTAACVYAVLIPFYVWLAVKHAPATEWSWKGVAWTITATIVASFGGIMFGFALRASNDAGVVTSLSSLSPIITMMLSFLLLGERPSVPSAVGCALVLAGVAIISLKS